MLKEKRKDEEEEERKKMERLRPYEEGNMLYWDQVMDAKLQEEQDQIRVAEAREEKDEKDQQQIIAKTQFQLELLELTRNSHESTLRKLRSSLSQGLHSC